MTVMLILFCLSIMAEVVLYFSFHSKLWRLPLVTLSIMTANFASGGLLLGHPNFLTVTVAFVSLYRAFNVIRIIKGRMHENYLRRAIWRTSYKLIAAQIVLGALWWMWYQTSQSHRTLWLVVSVLQLLVAIMLVASTMRRLARTNPGRLLSHYSDAQLPALTVAIPARNETNDLQQCLEDLVESDYPKLEIIVLDDCSQNKHTPEIIRSFAHDGVRFIQGEIPKPTWLPKNQAYDRLAHEASGEFILFCGVDVRFQPGSLRTIVSLALSRKKHMISVLPLQYMPTAHPRNLIVQSMRYWWEMAPPRRLFRRPAVISSCWLIERDALQKTGGFAAVTRSVVPEAYFAKALLTGDRYSFVRSDEMLGVVSQKHRSEQLETAIRMRYPQVHRRPEMAFLVAGLELLFLVCPFLIALLGWHMPITRLSQLCAAFTAILLTFGYVRLARAMHLSALPYALFGFPIMVLADIVILHRSMWQYEFSEVTWKGRNVCIPVMHTYASLPKITTGYSPPLKGSE